MIDFLNFFSSPIGVSISWICTVIGFIYGFKNKKEASKIKLENNSLQQQITNLNQKIYEYKQTQIRDNQQSFSQTGHTNINQGTVNGDFNFKN